MDLGLGVNVDVVEEVGRRKSNVDKYKDTEEEQKDVKDLTQLDNITLDNVLDCLISRFQSGLYCTFAGSVLVALNPCSFREDGIINNVRPRRRSSFMDDDKEVGKFVNLYLMGDKLKLEELEPHVLSIGVKSLYNLKNLKNDQVIAVSGDSGAGKTTCTQDLIRFFTFEELDPSEYTLEKKIYATTLVLEALGNAGTIANPNSSRFGRLVKLKFGFEKDDNNECKIQGAEINTYLLEKHRVAKGNKNERNFHIFHYLVQAVLNGHLGSPDLELFKRHRELFATLYWSTNADTDADRDNFTRFCTALVVLDLYDEFPEIYDYLFAILHLLAIDFEQEQDSDNDEEKENYPNVMNTAAYTVSNVSSSNLEIATSLLGVSQNSLQQSLVCKTFAAAKRKSCAVSPCFRKEECESRLHSLITSLYEKLFHHVVALLNVNLKGRGQDDDEKETISLSMLDLYGFESFDYNHLEQLCINYANERIQQLQIHVMKGYFKEEQKLRGLEEPKELNRLEIEFDSRLDQIHGQVFSVLDQASILNRPNATDFAVYEDLVQTSKDSKFIKSKSLRDSQCSFVIKHYASEVTYSLIGMKMKNTDFVPHEFCSLLSRSKRPFVSSLFPSNQVEPLESTPKRNSPKARNTILMRFKVSVDKLLSEQLNETESKDLHFIKCIRPNRELVRDVMDPHLIRKQLFASGIVDILKIAGNGVPIRMSLSKFRNDFELAIGIFGSEDPSLEPLVRLMAPSSVLKIGDKNAFMDENALNTLQRLIRIRKKMTSYKFWIRWKQVVVTRKKERSATTATLLSLDYYDSDQSVYMTPMNISVGESCSSFYTVASQRESDCSETTLTTSLPGRRLNLNETDSSLNSIISTTLAAGEEDKTNLSNFSFTLNDEGGDASTSLISRRAHQLSNLPVPNVPLYYCNRVLSRNPVHSVPLAKSFWKKNALGYPRLDKRFRSNGLMDLIQDHGIVTEPIDQNPPE